jgi:hypothetical protein
MTWMKIGVFEDVTFDFCWQMADAKAVVGIGFQAKQSNLAMLLHYDPAFKSDTSITPKCVHPLGPAAFPYTKKDGKCFFGH